MIVLDTNVVSESIRPEPSEDVAQWFAVRDKSEFFVASITLAEML